MLNADDKVTACGKGIGKEGGSVKLLLDCEMLLTDEEVEEIKSAG